MPTITCKVPDGLAVQLKALARQETRSRSAILQEALEEWLKAEVRRERICAYDLVKHLHGCIRGGLSDLATNPEHLYGFGE